MNEEMNGVETNGTSHTGEPAVPTQPVAVEPAPVVVADDMPTTMYASREACEAAWLPSGELRRTRKIYVVTSPGGTVRCGWGDGYASVAYRTLRGLGSTLSLATDGRRAVVTAAHVAAKVSAMTDE